VLSAASPGPGKAFRTTWTGCRSAISDIDVARNWPHASLRVYVMASAARAAIPSTFDDNQAMARLASEACAPARSAFSTSRTLNHRTSTGDFTPTLKDGEDELTAIADAMHGVGRSSAAFVLDPSTLDEDLPMYAAGGGKHQMPDHFTITQDDKRRGAGADVRHHQ